MRYIPSLRAIAPVAAALGVLTTLALGAPSSATVLAAPRAALAASDTTPTATPHTPCNLQCVIAFGDARIAERLTSLSKLNASVSARQSDATINSDQANALHADVSTNTAGLTSLKAKLDAETVESAARGDVKNIYEQFRIYAVVMPRDYRLLELDVEINIKDKLKALEPVIQAAIAGAPSGAQAQLTTLYNDYTMQVANAESQIDAAQGLYATLTPANYDTNKSGYDSDYTNYHNDIQTARKDLKAAGSDLHQIAQVLKANGAAKIKK